MVDRWPDERPVRELLSVCFRLGAQMLPEAMGLHNVFDCMEDFKQIMEMQEDPNRDSRIQQRRWFSSWWFQAMCGLFRTTTVPSRELLDRQKTELVKVFTRFVKSLEGA
jgi:hypothetical protein